MSNLSSPEFYHRRAEQERELAEAAGAPAVADIHLRMAEKYRSLAAQAEIAPRGPALEA